MEIEVNNRENILAVSASTWSVSLQLFRIDGEIPFDLFILTQISRTGKSSALYYFQKVAEKAFFRAVLELERLDVFADCSHLSRREL